MATINSIDGGSSSVLNGSSGDDRLMTDGNDQLNGGGGIDIADLRFQLMSTGVNIDLGEEVGTTGTPYYYYAGNGVYLNSIERVFFYGGSGNDVVKGWIYSDRLDGGLGADKLYGGGGADQLFGHNGNLLLDGGTGADIITIDGYVDQIDGGTDLTAGGAADYKVIDKLYITGTAGFDSAGHVGNIRNVEQIWVNAGLSPITFSHNDDPQSVTWLNGGTTPEVTYGQQIYVVDVPKAGGGFLGATITGTEFADSIRGGSGDDHIIGNKGDDVLRGGSGDDILEGGIGSDKLYGEDGNDHFIVHSGPSQQPDLLIDGGSGNDSLNLNEQFYFGDLVADFSSGSTVINGTAFVSIEQLFYDGAQGSDTVTGTFSADKINGRSGDDFIAGAGGDDLLWGGDGFDVAVFSGSQSDYNVTKNSNGTYTVSDTIAGRDGVDVIREFEVIRFSDLDVLL